MTLLPEDYLGEGVDSFSQFKHKKEFYGIRSYSDTLSKPVSYTHLTLPTKRIV